MKKKIPVLGKHSKEITCGAWSEDNRLALGSKDKNLTISTADGDELERTVLKKEPVEIQFMTKAFNAKQNNNNEQKNGGGGKVSINMDGQRILLYDLDDPDNPVELEFQKKYGDIVSYKWFGEGCVAYNSSNQFIHN